MGVIQLNSTMMGCYTPICNECGVVLCWDISFSEYEEAEIFWDRWICKGCNGDTPLSLTQWLAENKENK